MQHKVKYAPEVFVLPDVEMAKKIILTTEVGLSSEERWERETPWLRERMQFDHDRLVVDYGCGVGRLAKLYQQPVLGVDISPTMRAHAEQYVARPNFMAVHPPMFDCLIRAGLRAHGALAVWVLQHILNPSEDIDMLAACLLPGSPLYLVNRDHRAVPARTGDIFSWIEDSLDIFAMLGPWFELEWSEEMPEELCEPGASIGKWVRTSSILNSRQPAVAV